MTLFLFGLSADGYGEEDVLYVWTHGADKSIKMAMDMKLSQYDLVGVPSGNATAMSAGKAIVIAVI